MYIPIATSEQGICYHSYLKCHVILFHSIFADDSYPRLTSPAPKKRRRNTTPSTDAPVTPSSTRRMVADIYSELSPDETLPSLIMLPTPERPTTHQFDARILTGAMKDFGTTIVAKPKSSLFDLYQLDFVVQPSSIIPKWLGPNPVELDIEPTPFSAGGMRNAFMAKRKRGVSHSCLPDGKLVFKKLHATLVDSYAARYGGAKLAEKYLVEKVGTSLISVPVQVGIYAAV